MAARELSSVKNSVFLNFSKITYSKYPVIFFSRTSAGRAPVILSIGFPFLKITKVGITLILNFAAIS